MCIKIIRVLKKLYIYIRSTIKLISLVVLGTVLIGAAIVLVYKPIYKVTIDGKKVGYCEDRNKLQDRINEYMEKGEEGQEHVAFVQVDALPEYSMCLLKKGIVTNDEEIYQTVKDTGITYYRYYAIVENEKEKTYLASFEEAENTIEKLKNKKSENASRLTIIEKYETELPQLTETSKAVSSLYKEKKTIAKATNRGSSYSSPGAGKVSTSRELNNKRVDLGMSLRKPVSGVLTSRYGYRWGRTHTGIDIGVPTGTPVKAAAGGTITFSGMKGSLGKLVVINHGNGIQTYYGHNSKLTVSAGQKVEAGQVIAKAGSTGRSTGSHVHFEIRVKGSSINPQRYIGY